MFIILSLDLNFNTLAVRILCIVFTESVPGSVMFCEIKSFLLLPFLSKLYYIFQTINTHGLQRNTLHIVICGSVSSDWIYNIIIQ